MADTLRSLAGDRFKMQDVISALHPPLEPEQLVLDRYVFLPYTRTGIAAALNTPFDWTLPTRGSVNMRVPVIDDRGGLDAEMTVRIYGPADVTEIDTRQIIRTFPKADVVNAEVDDLVHVEFDRPDLPWLFTPAGPDGQGHLVPWITLVVAERRHVDWGEQHGSARIARIRRDQLQPLHDAWAWAHAQVMGAKGATPATEPTLERRLSESNAPLNLSRLVCPRRLDDHTHYVACVVPTFLAGAQMGLGIAPATTLAPAWGTRDNFGGGDPFDMVPLPVYYSWSFGTAAEGNFESLARKLRPAVAPPGVGRRRIDTTQAWPDLDLESGDSGAEMVVTGPIVSPQAPATEPDEAWPSEPKQQWRDEVTRDLAERLNRPDQQAHEPEPGAPVVGPPLYGGTHARQPRVEMDAPRFLAQPEWFRELNLDPRHRIVAGLGTRVVQTEQESLMLAAWNQVIGIEAANRALRLAQMAKHVGASLHRRHLSRMSDAALVSVTERVHPKILDVPGRSVWASIKNSSLPATVTVGAFRRFTRLRGPVVRTAVRAQAQRAAAVDALTVRNDRFTTNWVLSYKSPDGIHALGGIAAGLVSDRLAAQIMPGTDAPTLLARWRTDLAKLSTPDHFTPAELQNLRLRGTVDIGQGLLASLADRLVGTMPTEREMEGDREAALTGASHAPMLRVLAEIAGATGGRGIPVRASDAKRLRLAAVGRPDDAARVLVISDAIINLGVRATEFARRHHIDIPVEDFDRSARDLRQLATRSLRFDSGTVAGALKTIGSKITLKDPFAEGARDRIHVPTLDLLARLNPAVTVHARVMGRLTGGTGRMPKWLAPDWFAEQKVEPVMAHPRFKHPMYEPLDRYDREWLVPGLGLIKKPEMATLLVTNNRFVEAYLVGLNHEMGRELLWREFPTDQRGTYFSSFWTGEPELVADMHELPWRNGPLGKHVDPALDGQLVFLVRGDLIRRFPGVVAHAALEARVDNGIPVFAAASPARTLFHVFLLPNILLVGFGITRARLDTRGEEWWFTLSENPTEPRFGLDPSRSGAPTRDNLIWDDFGVSKPGQFLDATQHTALAFGDLRWGDSSASVAHLLFQLPARAAFRATKMVAGTIS